MTTINSLDNPKIKSALKLLKSSERRERGEFLIEGERELSLALAGGIKLTNLFYCPELIKSRKLLSLAGEETLIEVNQKVFAKLSMRDNPDGWLGLAEAKEQKLSDIKLSANPLVIVIEAVEKPGNLGAILRSADAAGVDALIIDDPKVDIYNPNVIRASQGTVFTRQIAIASFQEIIQWLRDKQIKIFATTPEATKIYSQVDFRQPTAIVMGAEDTGLSQEWFKAADEKIKIFMQGKIDSLNVSVTTAIIIFEALRQREIK